MNFNCYLLYVLICLISISNLFADEHYDTDNYEFTKYSLSREYNQYDPEYDFNLELNSTNNNPILVTQNKYKNNIFSIHTGYSPYYGFLGIEYQFYKFSLNLGMTDKLNGGIKFYLRKGLCDTVYFGAFGTFIGEFGAIGHGVGYRWVKESGLTIHLGIGFGLLIKDESNSDYAQPVLVPNLTIGWSF